MARKNDELGSGPHRLAAHWTGQYRLVGRIWKGDFPDARNKETTSVLGAKWGQPPFLARTAPDKTGRREKGRRLTANG